MIQSAKKKSHTDFHLIEWVCEKINHNASVLFLNRHCLPHLKVHRNGRTSPLLLIVGGQQLDLSADLRLLHSSHALYPDHKSITKTQTHSLTHTHTRLSQKGTELITDFHTMAFSLALYLALPFMQITCTPLVFRGVGMRTCNQEQLINDLSFSRISK